MAVVYRLKYTWWSAPQRMHTSGYGTSWISCTLHVLCLIASCSMVQCRSEADSLVLNSIVEYLPGSLVFPRMRRKRREGRKGRDLICFLVSVIKQWPKTACGRREFVFTFRSHSSNEGSQYRNLESGKDHGRSMGTHYVFFFQLGLVPSWVFRYSASGYNHHGSVRHGLPPQVGPDMGWPFLQVLHHHYPSTFTGRTDCR